MSTIESGISLFDAQSRMNGLREKKLMHISEASEEIYKNYVNSGERLLEARYRKNSGEEDNPRNQEYASIEVNGRTVASIDNNGFVGTSNGVSNALQQLFAREGNGLNGPALAEERAAKIAATLGGKVVKSSTALTQSEYNATPAPGMNVDVEALRQDPFYAQLQKTKQARDAFLAQSIGQGDMVVQAGAVNLQTSLGRKSIDIESYFNPKPSSKPFKIDEIPLILPSAENINALSQHAEGAFKELLSANNIPQGPDQISYDNEGNLKLPDDYQYKDELKEALDGNPALASELRTIAALSSHNVGMQGGIQGHAKITLDFNDQGQLSVNANGRPFAGVGDGLVGTNVAESQQASSSYEAGETNKSDAEQWFQDYLNKTPEERMYEALLREKGLTPEQYAALPQEEKLAIQQELEAEMKKRFENDIGLDGAAVET